MVDTRRKRVIYKHAKFHNADNRTLQDLLTLATQSVKKPENRKESIDTDNKIVRVLNRVIGRDNMFLGELLLWEEGKTQSAVSQDDEGFYTVESLGLPASAESGKKREYLESQLIFSVYGNHLAVLQSRTLQAKQLEAHLLWFISNFTDGLKKEAYFVLSDEPTLEARRQIKQAGGVKDISLGFPIQSEQIDDKSIVEQSVSIVAKASENAPKVLSRVQNLLFRPIGKASEILTAAFGEDWTKKTNLLESLDKANMEVELKVKYVRKTTEQAHTLLDNMATAARHLDTDFTRITLQNGAIIKGDLMKISGPINVIYIRDVIDLNSLYSELNNWLLERFNHGEIE